MKATLESWLKPDPELEEIGSIVWLLSCAFSMTALQAGFAMLESGLMPARSNVNVNVQNLVGAAIVGVFFFLTGWGFAFGDSHKGFIGKTQFALEGLKEVYFYKFFFHWVFASTAITVTSGAVAGRMKFPAFVTYTAFIASFVYSVPAHWTFAPEGWLREMGYYDFAGCGAIHLTGAMCGLAGSIALGPRQGIFLEKGRTLSSYSYPGHALFGMIIIVCGWLAFNAGATMNLSAAEGLAAKAMVNTGISAGFGGVAGVILSYWLNGWKHIDLVETSLGAMGGMVSIAAACSDCDPWYSGVIGAVGGIICPLFSRLLKHLRVDDPVFVASVHGASAFWGLISVAFFVKGEVHSQKGFAHGGEIDLLGHQLAGALSIMVWSFGISFAFLKVYNIFWPLRATPEEERAGLDASEHGLVTMAVKNNLDRTKELAEAVAPLGMNIRQMGELVYITLDDVDFMNNLGLHSGSTATLSPNRPQPTSPGQANTSARKRLSALSQQEKDKRASKASKSLAFSNSEMAAIQKEEEATRSPERGKPARNSTVAWSPSTTDVTRRISAVSMSANDPLLLEAICRLSKVVPPKDIEVLADDGCRKSVQLDALPELGPNEHAIAVIRKSRVAEEGETTEQAEESEEETPSGQGCVIA